MKIALAQLNYTIGDIDGNTSKIIDSINKAKAQRADLVIFAEQAVSGTPAFDLLRKTTFLELCEDALVEIASCCDGIAAIVGLPILTREGTISAAALMVPSRVRIGSPTMAAIPSQHDAISTSASSHSSRKVVLRNRSKAGVPLTACSAKITRSARCAFALLIESMIFEVLPSISPIV